MPKPNALVEGISSVSPKSEALKAITEGPQIVTVNFSSGRTGRLDIRSPLSAHWAKVLNRLKQENRIVYVEIDPETNVITNLIIPETSRVWTIDVDAAGNVEVRLLPSQAPHYILRKNPDFELMMKALQSAKEHGSEVLVTTDPQNREIVDVRPFQKSANEQEQKPSNSPSPPPVDPDEQTAQNLFNSMKSLSCDPYTAAAPCIPFLYPDDGCYARAHEMCRLMSLAGETPEKIWIYSSSDSALSPATSNNINCVVHWWYHVAPTLLVTLSNGNTERRVIDPSLCDGPVPEDEWKSKQNDSGATLEYSSASIYFKGEDDPTGVPDNNYTQTNQALQDKRDALIDNCLKYGPPPYSCPIIKNCFFIVDRSAFGQNEVAALLQQSNPAIVEAAFYVVVDGFAPADLGITAATFLGSPNVKPSLTPVPQVSGMDFEATQLVGEDQTHLLRRQRLTWIYRVKFSSVFANEVAVQLNASISNLSASAIIYLIGQPNPYEVDGPVSWLSTDLRVFQIKAGDSKFGVTMGSMPADASTFITQVVANLNSGNTGGQTFDNDISTDQQTSQLELSEKVNGTQVFNFAIAKVRYRSLAATASDVRVFFRIFSALTTSLDYNQTTTYRTGGQAEAKIPLLGVQNSQLVAIPCFAAPRIDASTVNMNAQTDSTNIQSIPPDSNGAEVTKFFGCWLDINQPKPQFPIQPIPLDGPFQSSSMKSIQELIRNVHQCLVSEIAFDPVPIPPSATPGTSDKLAQRNLAISDSANPGYISSRRIPQTFEIRPTPAELQPNEIPDELMINWGNIPIGSLATLYLPEVNVDTVDNMIMEMYRAPKFARIDEHTLQFATDGMTYIPIPKGSGVNFTGLITVDLPSTVKQGQAFTFVVRQVTNATKGSAAVLDPRKLNQPRVTASRVRISWRQVIGTFQTTIPVKKKEAILEREERALSNLRWIEKAVPANNRWFNAFHRYIDQIGGRVDGLGGDSSKVNPSPSGEWQKLTTQRCKTLALLNAAMLAILIVMLGTQNAITILLFVALMILTLAIWMIQCHPKLCVLLKTFFVGAGIGGIVLLALAVMGELSMQILTVLGVTAVLLLVAGLVGIIHHCF